MNYTGNTTTLQNIFFAFAITTFGAITPAVAQEATTEASVAVVSIEERFVSALQSHFAEGGRELADFAEFYAARNNQPIWADGNTQSMLALLTTIEQALHHGLPLESYNTANLEALWMAGNLPEDLAALEAVAAQTYVKFAKEISSGVLNPSDIYEEISLDVLDPSDIHEEINVTRQEINTTRRVPKTRDVLRAVAAANDKAAYYQTLPPSAPEYALLLDLKKDLEALISGEGWGPLVPIGDTLRPGQSNARVAALRMRLQQRGYDLIDATSTAYSKDLVAAVKAFQIDFGLNSDGIVGPQTLASINVQPAGRLKQVIVNLERVRWMNYDLGDRHIYVNIPDYTASVMDYGVPTLSFRVVVGTDENQTTEFSNSMTHMIINPTWNVPYSIASEEYLPKLLSDPTLLERENIRMEVLGSGQIVDSTAIDFSLFTEETFPFLLRQQPGPWNALGRVKFMFPNKYNIYLHDTPSRSLFAQDARAFSHGCVRVQKPMELAYTLLSLQETDPKGTFTTALESEEETQIALEKPVPVHIVYRTVWFDALGDVQYRHDVYGRDALVYDALINVGVTLPALES